MYHVWKKRATIFLCLVACQMLTNFKNTFTSRLCSKFLVKCNKPHLKCVTTLPCEILMPEKQAETYRTIHDKVMFQSDLDVVALLLVFHYKFTAEPALKEFLKSG